MLLPPLLRGEQLVFSLLQSGLQLTALLPLLLQPPSLLLHLLLSLHQLLPECVCVRVRVCVCVSK